MKIHPLRAAFTLIELLVVISIIAILAGLAMPVFNNVLATAKMTNAMNNARQIGLALRTYSNDNDGLYPGLKDALGNTVTTSNDAFRGLFPSYLDNEKVFAVAGSKAGPSADNRITPVSEVLTQGENHWAYVAALSSTSNSAWPLIVDHTDGSGYYNKHEGELGGTWKGTKSVVIHVDTSATITPLLGTEEQRYIPRSDDKTKNALELDYMGNNVKLLEPSH